MVMDATQPQQPSPQSVGREFVRQYYTLLNKAPNHLHRFYNNNSSFIHGESTLVVGQKNIHNRIQQLNFHDCHAKISQVDAQATLGNGVVVQVTGELSNDGQPMRRFTQTFVLAAQTPKKYYVHNDIFRYQDMYSDEDNEGEVHSENGDDLEQQTSTSGNGGGGDQASTIDSGIVSDTPTQLPSQLVTAGGVIQQQQQPQQAPAAIYYSMPTAGGRPVPVLAAAPPAAAVPLSAQFPAVAGTIAPQQQPVPTSATTGVSQLNGGVAHDDLMSGMPQNAPTAVVAGTAAVSQSGVGGTSPVQGVTGAVTVIPQNSGTAIPTFQQSPLLPQQQQQMLPQSQQHHSTSQSASSVSNLQPQGSQLANTSANSANDYDDGNNLNSIASNNDVSISNAAPPSEHLTVEHTNIVTSAPVVDDFKTINEQQLQEKYEASKHQQNEPKTYANLFKSTSTSPSSFVNAALQQQQQVQQQQQQQQPISNNTNFQQPSSIPSATFTQSNVTSSGISGGYNRQNNTAVDNNSQSVGGGSLPQRTSSGRINKDYEPRRTSNAQQFGDNHQLFLGNIPHHASEEELKAIFARFGTIVDLRILSKPGGKLPPGVRNPLNYGFITYEDPESVQLCLAAGHIYFPENSPDAQKLNVEEKKPRLRSDLPPRQSMGSNMNSGGGMGGNQRNMSGGPQSRSLSNSGGGGNNSGMMRGPSGGNNMSRGGSNSGQRIGGGFNRNDNRNGSQPNGGGPQMRGGNNNSQSGGGGNSYAGRR